MHGDICSKCRSGVQTRIDRLRLRLIDGWMRQRSGVINGRFVHAREGAITERALAARRFCAATGTFFLPRLWEVFSRGSNAYARH
jgi:hypothetical protein